MIYHLTAAGSWSLACTQGVDYTHPSLTTEGLIHCARADQLDGVVQRYFSGWTEVEVLCIDVAQVEAEIRWEGPIATGGPFPHIYGPLNLNAVLSALHLKADAAGRFPWPFDTSSQGEGGGGVSTG